MRAARALLVLGSLALGVAIACGQRDECADCSEAPGAPGPGMGSSAPDVGRADAGADAGDAASASFAGQVQTVFSIHCLGCHGDGAAGGLNLAPGRAWANLVDAPSTCAPAAARVKPGDPGASQLVLKLAADPRRCGAAMPLDTIGLKAYLPEEYGKVEAWVAQGAKND